MKISSNIHHRRSATMLLAWILLLACSLFPFDLRSPETATNQPAGAVTLSPGQVIGTATATNSPVGQIEATATTAAESTVTTGPYSLEISDSYPLDVANGVLGLSMTTSPGKVWLGTGKGTIEQADSQSGTFVQSIPLITGESLGFYLVPTLEFNGHYIAALEVTLDLKSLNLFAIEPSSGKVVQQWDMQSPDWSEESRMFTSTVLGVSPGKIWVDGHVIDTQIFDVKKVSMLPMTRFGYNGKGWMWITGQLRGELRRFDICQNR